MVHCSIDEAGAVALEREMEGDGGTREMEGDGGRWREMEGDGGRWSEIGLALKPQCFDLGLELGAARTQLLSQLRL